jgi:hypothetical protein
VDIPLVGLADGVHSRSFAGNGVVVHHSDTFGLVLVDRNTVAIGPCDVNLSFGAHPAEVPGTVRFLHPLHNFALVSFNPAELPAEARRKVAAAPLLPAPALARGDSVRLVGLTRYLRLMTRTSIVTSATSALTIPSAEVPRWVRGGWSQGGARVGVQCAQVVVTAGHRGSVPGWIQEEWVAV